MTTSRLYLSGIRAEGRHGANPGERLEPQEFVIDLDVLVEVGDDSIDDTADYRALVDVARSAVEDGSYTLLETLAHAVARAVFGQENVQRVIAVVHKPGAASSLGMDDVAAEAIAG